MSGASTRSPEGDQTEGLRSFPAEDLQAVVLSSGVPDSEKQEDQDASSANIAGALQQGHDSGVTGQNQQRTGSLKNSQRLDQEGVAQLSQPLQDTPL